MSNVVALREREDPHPGPLPEGEGETAQGELLPEVSLDMQRLFAAEGDDEVELQVSKWGGILGQMLAKQAAAFERMGHSAEASNRLARAGILALAELVGGQNWYFPSGEALREELRDIEIWRRFNGNNIKALAREYRLTIRQVYRILLKQRRWHVDRRQGTLPFEPAGDKA